jgi:hypothetical protein
VRDPSAERREHDAAERVLVDEEDGFWHFPQQARVLDGDRRLHGQSPALPVEVAVFL